MSAPPREVRARRALRLPPDLGPACENPAYPPAARSVTLELPEPPSANRWWRNYGGRMVLSEAARAYKQTVEAACWRARRRGDTWPLFPEGDVCVSVVWSRQRKSGDLDKRLGVLFDSLQGMIYRSDAQVSELHAWRVDEASRAGTVTVTVERQPEG